MTDVLFVFGILVAVSLVALLGVTVHDGRVRFWPTPGPGTWQSLTFWTLFRSLNICTILLAIADRESFVLGHWLHYLVGIPLLVGGFGLYFVACFTLGKPNTYCRPERLVTGGIYRWTRNPQYATVIPAYAGLAITANSGYTYILTLALAATYVLMAVAEEPWLAQAYGAAYGDYRKRVPRFYNWAYAFDALSAATAALPRTLKARQTRAEGAPRRLH